LQIILRILRQAIKVCQSMLCLNYYFWLYCCYSSIFKVRF